MLLSMAGIDSGKPPKTKGPHEWNSLGQLNGKILNEDKQMC